MQNSGALDSASAHHGNPIGEKTDDRQTGLAHL
jgi:hypothetical protein